MSVLSDLRDEVLAAVRNLPGKRQGSEKARAALDQAIKLETFAASEVEAAKVEIKAAIEVFDMDRGAEGRQRLADAEFSLETARVSVGKLRLEVEGEDRREDQDRRRAAYAAAEKEIEAGARIVRKAYPGAARDIVVIIEQIAQSEALTANVNANLPDGAVPLLSIEERFLRHGFPREDLSNEKVSRWVVEATGERVVEDRQSDVIDHGAGRGTLPHPENAGPMARQIDTGSAVVQREFWRTVFLPHVAGHPVDDGFASRINLPGLAHQAPFWTPSYDDSASTVLKHLEAVRAYARDFKKVNERRAVVEFTAIPAPAPAEA